MSLKVGDVVTLVSGSPRMTVVAIESDMVSCAYFKAGACHSFSAPERALELFQDDTPSAPSQLQKWLAAGRNFLGSSRQA